MRAKRALGPCAAVVFFCVAGTAASADDGTPTFSDQPANKASWLSDNRGKRPQYENNKGQSVDLLDKQLAQLFRSLLVQNGESNIKDAVFLFNSCYGGGFLDDLKDELGNDINWVGASASKHNQPAGGTKGNDSGPEATGAWTKELIDRPRGKLLRGNPRVVDAVNGAHKANTNRANARYPETGQTVTGGDANSIRMRNGRSAHAILWAGKVNLDHFYNDIERTRELLEDKWAHIKTRFGDEAVTITTLYGDGEHRKGTSGATLPDDWNASPATGQNLKDAIDALRRRLGPREKFFFYASDHGGVPTTVRGTPRPVGGFGISNDAFSLDEGEMSGIRWDKENETTLTVSTSQLQGSALVSLNGTILGEVFPSEPSQIFAVPEEILGLDNLVQIENLSGTDFELNSIEFDTGAIGFTPSPGTPVLLVTGALVVGRRRRG